MTARPAYVGLIREQPTNQQNHGVTARQTNSHTPLADHSGSNTKMQGINMKIRKAQQLVLLVGVTVFANISGTVKSLDQHPIRGVLISLSSGKASCESDADGNWEIVTEQSTVVHSYQKNLQRKHITIREGKRLSIQYDEHNINGSKQVQHRTVEKYPNLSPKRTFSVSEDTLLVKIRNKTLAREPVASLTDYDFIIDTAWSDDNKIPWNSKIRYSTKTDTRDGKSYRTVRIGEQEWMAENLDFTKNDSIGILHFQGYGRLYRWDEVMSQVCIADTCTLDTSGTKICPVGMHLPTRPEIKMLSRILISNHTDSNHLGGALKARTLWIRDSNGTDQYGFRGIPYSKQFNPGVVAAWWTSTPGSSAWTYYPITYKQAYSMSLSWMNSHITIGQSALDELLAVRCVSDPKIESYDTLLAKLQVERNSLQPKFQPQISSYTIDTLPSFQSILSVTPTPRDLDAFVTCNKTKCDSIVIEADHSTVLVEVRNGSNIFSYTIIVNRHKSNPLKSVIDWNDGISYGNFTDPRDGRQYKTITIGGKEWLAENLNYSVIGICPQNSSDSCNKYGRYYTWSQAMNLQDVCNKSDCAIDTTNIQGICPSGWHLPRPFEWDSLIAKSTINTWASTSNASNVLRSGAGWTTSNGNDYLGFRILPSGRCITPTTCYGIGSSAELWMFNIGDTYGTLFKVFGKDRVTNEFDWKTNYNTIRCVRDDRIK